MADENERTLEEVAAERLQALIDLARADADQSDDALTALVELTGLPLATIRTTLSTDEGATELAQNEQALAAVSAHIQLNSVIYQNLALMIEAASTGDEESISSLTELLDLSQEDLTTALSTGDGKRGLLQQLSQDQDLIDSMMIDMQMLASIQETLATMIDAAASGDAQAVSGLTEMSGLSEDALATALSTDDGKRDLLQQLGQDQDLMDSMMSDMQMFASLQEAFVSMIEAAASGDTQAVSDLVDATGLSENDVATALSTDDGKRGLLQQLGQDQDLIDSMMSDMQMFASVQETLFLMIEASASGDAQAAASLADMSGLSEDDLTTALSTDDGKSALFTNLLQNQDVVDTIMSEAQLSTAAEELIFAAINSDQDSLAMLALHSGRSVEELTAAFETEAGALALLEDDVFYNSVVNSIDLSQRITHISFGIVQAAVDGDLGAAATLVDLTGKSEDEIRTALSTEDGANALLQDPTLLSAIGEQIVAASSSLIAPDPDVPAAAPEAEAALEAEASPAPEEASMPQRQLYQWREMLADLDSNPELKQEFIAAYDAAHGGEGAWERNIAAQRAEIEEDANNWAFSDIWDGNADDKLAEFDPNALLAEWATENVLPTHEGFLAAARADADVVFADGWDGYIGGRLSNIARQGGRAGKNARDRLESMGGPEAYSRRELYQFGLEGLNNADEHHSFVTTDQEWQPPAEMEAATTWQLDAWSAVGVDATNNEEFLRIAQLAYEQEHGEGSWAEHVDEQTEQHAELRRISMQYSYGSYYAADQFNYDAKEDLVRWYQQNVLIRTPEFLAAAQADYDSVHGEGAWERRVAAEIAEIEEDANNWTFSDIWDGNADDKRERHNPEKELLEWAIERMNSSPTGDLDWSNAVAFGLDNSVFDYLDSQNLFQDEQMYDLDSEFGQAFLNAAKILYNERENQTWGEYVSSQGWDEDRAARELAQYGEGEVQWFRSNVASALMAMTTDTPRAQVALMYLNVLESHTETTLGDFGAEAWRGVVDPTFIAASAAAAASGGTAAAAAFGARMAAHFTARQAIQKALLRVGTGILTGAVEGAISEAMLAGIEQRVQLTNGLRDEVNWNAVGTRAAFGGVMGAGMGAGFVGLGAGARAAIRAIRGSAVKSFSFGNIAGRLREALPTDHTPSAAYTRFLALMDEASAIQSRITDDGSIADADATRLNEILGEIDEFRSDNFDAAESSLVRAAIAELQTDARVADDLLREALAGIDPARFGPEIPATLYDGIGEAPPVRAAANADPEVRVDVDAEGRVDPTPADSVGARMSPDEVREAAARSADNENIDPAPADSVDPRMSPDEVREAAVRADNDNVELELAATGTDGPTLTMETPSQPWQAQHIPTAAQAAAHRAAANINNGTGGIQFTPSGRTANSPGGAGTPPPGGAGTPPPGGGPPGGGRLTRPAMGTARLGSAKRRIFENAVQPVYNEALTQIRALPRDASFASESRAILSELDTILTDLKMQAVDRSGLNMKSDVLSRYNTRLTNLRNSFEELIAPIQRIPDHAELSARITSSGLDAQIAATKSTFGRARRKAPALDSTEQPGHFALYIEQYYNKAVADLNALYSSSPVPDETALDAILQTLNRNLDAVQARLDDVASRPGSPIDTTAQNELTTLINNIETGVNGWTAKIDEAPDLATHAARVRGSNIGLQIRNFTADPVPKNQKYPIGLRVRDFFYNTRRIFLARSPENSRTARDFSHNAAMSFRSVIDTAYRATSDADFDSALNTSLDAFETRIQELKDALSRATISEEARVYREASSDIGKLTAIQRDAIAKDLERMEDLVSTMRSYTGRGRQNFIDQFLDPSITRVMDRGSPMHIEDMLLAASSRVSSRGRSVGVSGGNTFRLPGRISERRVNTLFHRMQQGADARSDSLRSLRFSPDNQENLSHGEIIKALKEKAIAYHNNSIEVDTYKESIANLINQAYEQGLEVDILRDLDFAHKSLGAESTTAVVPNATPFGERPVFRDILQMAQNKAQDTYQNDPHYLAYLERIRYEDTDNWAKSPYGSEDSPWWTLGHVDGGRFSTRERMLRYAADTRIGTVFEQYRSGTNYTSTYADYSALTGRKTRKWKHMVRRLWIYATGDRIDYGAQGLENGRYVTPTGYNITTIKANEEGFLPVGLQKVINGASRPVRAVWNLSGFGLPKNLVRSIPSTWFGGLGEYASTRSILIATDVLSAGSAVGLVSTYGLNGVPAWAAGSFVMSAGDNISSPFSGGDDGDDDPGDTPEADELRRAEIERRSALIKAWVDEQGRDTLSLPHYSMSSADDDYIDAIAARAASMWIDDPTTYPYAANVTAITDAGFNTLWTAARVAEDAERREAAIRDSLVRAYREDFGVVDNMDPATVSSLHFDDVLGYLLEDTADNSGDNAIATESLQNPWDDQRDLFRQRVQYYERSINERPTRVTHATTGLNALIAANPGIGAEADSIPVQRAAAILAEERDENGNFYTEEFLTGSEGQDRLTTVLQEQVLAYEEERTLPDRRAAARAGLVTWLQTNATSPFRALDDNPDDGAYSADQNAAIDAMVTALLEKRDTAGNVISAERWATTDDAEINALRREAYEAYMALLRHENGGDGPDADEDDPDADTRDGPERNGPDADLSLTWEETKQSAANSFSWVTDHDGDGYSLFVDTEGGRFISGMAQSAWRGVRDFHSDLSLTEGGRQTINGAYAVGIGLLSPWLISFIPGFSWVNSNGLVRFAVMAAAFFVGWKALNGGMHLTTDSESESGGDGTASGDGNFIDAARASGARIIPHDGSELPRQIILEYDIDDDPEVEQIYLTDEDGDGQFAVMVADVNGETSYLAPSVINPSTATGSTQFTPKENGFSIVDDSFNIQIDLVDETGATLSQPRMTINGETVDMNALAAADAQRVVDEKVEMIH